MRIDKTFSLKSLNTFSIDAIADSFYHCSNEEEIRTVLKEHQEVQVLGGGSNILFLKDRIEVPVLQVGIMGIEQVFEDDNRVVVAAGAGEEWQSLVDFCVDGGFGGIENLTLIPGKVGAAPIQNIGAYGVELKDCFYALEAIEKSTGRLLTFHHQMCQFGYRDSVFKREKKNQFIITRVFLSLEKNHAVNSAYGGIQMRLNTLGIKDPSIKDMAEVIANVRREKLPYPDQLPNAGSFFQNPIIERSHLEKLEKEHPLIPFYEWETERVKIPAAWLIEQVNFKGFRKGDAGVYEKHALILVNHGKASGQDIYNLSENIIDAVRDRFNIDLIREVNVVA